MINLLLILAFMLSAVRCLGQDSRGSVQSKIDAYVNPFVEAGQFSGILLAAQNGKIVYEKAFGPANAEFSIPNRVNTRIGIASITKPMTSVILIRLLEEKRLTLHDKVNKYIPDFPNGNRITVEMLSDHRSGIPHRVMSPEWEAVAHTSADMVEKIKLAKLEFEPGTQELYSSAGYSLLARILEIASGKPYAQLLQEYVFTPCGMTESLDFNSEAIMVRRAQEYLLDATGIIQAPLKDYSFLVGAGSVYSTARDVYKFGESVVNGALGESVRANFVRNGIMRSNGSTNGHRATLKINAEKRYGYVLISNLASGAIDLIIKNMEAILEGNAAESPAVAHPTITPVSEMILADYVGQYQRTEGGSGFAVTIKNNLISAGDIKLYPIGPDCFFEYKYFGEVCFLRDATGTVRSMNWIGTGFKLEWRRQ
ncbi:MAG: serine hydrolase domain-containing protein [Bacteroidota bacterium]